MSENDVERVRTVGDYTTSELAQKAGVDISRIRQLLGDGTLKGVKRGRDWLVYRWSAEAWLENRAVG